MDVSQIGLHFKKGELDRVEVEADLAGLQLQAARSRSSRGTRS